MSTPSHEYAPTNDPRDGRIQCPGCKRYVWPVIHSCPMPARTLEPVTEINAFRRMPAGGTTNREPPPEAETTLERIGQLQDDLDTAEDRLKHERGIWWVAMDGLQAENERLVDEVSRLQAEVAQLKAELATAHLQVDRSIRRIRELEGGHR